MGSHSVTCHPTEVKIPQLPPAEAGTWYCDPGGMQGWVDLCYMKADSRELNSLPVNRKSNALPLIHHATWSVFTDRPFNTAVSLECGRTPKNKPVAILAQVLYMPYAPPVSQPTVSKHGKKFRALSSTRQNHQSTHATRKGSCWCHPPNTI